MSHLSTILRKNHSTSFASFKINILAERAVTGDNMNSQGEKQCVVTQMPNRKYILHPV